MGRETRSTSTRPILRKVLPGGQGLMSARRFSVPQAPTSSTITLPGKVRFVVLRNRTPTGESIRINFNNDENSNFWELSASDGPLRLEITDSVIVRATCMGAVGTLEAIFTG